jgi:hypothetical protein
MREKDKKFGDHLRSRAGWEDIIKVYLKEIKFEIAYPIHLTLDGEQLMG